MNDRPYKVRTMNRKDVDLAIDWAAQEGWNPGIYDADSFYAADTNGFLVGILGDEPIAVISAIKYGRSFGFIGFYMVKPRYRGQGYGIQIWDAALKYLEGRNIGLDGVVGQQENYKKSGFTLAYRNIRQEGRSGGPFPEDPDIVELTRLPMETIDAYDRFLFPENRTEFLKSWISQPGCKALGVLQNDTLSGYGVLRKCRSGYKIGPLFANSPDLAERLFQSLQSGIKQGEPLYLDTPEVNHAAVALAQRYHMKAVFETARMYTEEKPDIQLNHVFGVTSFELG